MSDTEETPVENPDVSGDSQQESEVDLADLDDEDGVADGDAEIDEDDEEIEIRGQRRKAKEVAEILAKADNLQRDYTKSKMALAEQERQLQQRLEYTESLAKQRESEIERVSKIKEQASDELAEFQQIDWEKVVREDPQNGPAMFAIAQHRAQQRMLQIQQAEQATTQLMEQRAQEEWSELTRAIPELTDPVKGQEISRDIETVLQTFGISHIPDHKIGVMVAKMLPLIEDGAKYRDLLKRKAEKTRSNASSNAPEPPVSAKTVKSASNRLDDNLPMDEWLKRRNAQLKRR